MTDRIPAVSVDEARARLDGEGAVVLDVREADEWNAGHVDGSTWIPMGDLSSRQDEIPEGMHLVVVCHSGGRSARVVQALVAAGYDASNLVGGLDAWAQAGHPLVAEGGGPGTVG
jgi:rhodanese-related sulfurtransferase